MQYNESQYNGDEYNLTNYVSILTETLTPSDTLTFSVEITKTDSQGTADAISDGVSLAAMLDTVTIYQRAHTPFAYNNGQYNMFMYNVRADEDEILLMAIKAMTDILSLSDSLTPLDVEKVLPETATLADALTLSSHILFLDFLFMGDFLSVSVTNKALFDSVRMSDWLTVKRNPQNAEWFD